MDLVVSRGAGTEEALTTVLIGLSNWAFGQLAVKVSRGHPTTLIGWGVAKCPPPLQCRCSLVVAADLSSLAQPAPFSPPVKRRQCWLRTPWTYASYATSRINALSGLRGFITFIFRLGCGLAPQGHTAVEKVLKSSFWSPPLKSQRRKESRCYVPSLGPPLLGSIYTAFWSWRKQVFMSVN